MVVPPDRFPLVAYLMLRVERTCFANFWLRNHSALLVYCSTGDHVGRVIVLGFACQTELTAINK